MKKIKSPYFTYPRLAPSSREGQKNDNLPRMLGSRQIFKFEFSRMVRNFSKPDQTLTVLDLAAGSGIFSRLIADLSKAGGWDISISAIDFDKSIVEAARAQSQHYPQIHFAFQPFHELHKLRPQNFDIVICCFALYLLSTEKAVSLIHSIDRLAKRGWLIMDLKRSRSFSFLVETISPWLAKNQTGDRDAVRLTQQAFSAHEMKNLAFHAGIEDYVSKSWLYFNQTLIRRKKSFGITQNKSFDITQDK